MRIIVLDLLAAVKRTAIAQMANDVFIRSFYKNSHPGQDFSCKFTLGVHRIYKGEIVAHAQAVVVCPKSRCGMHYARAVAHGNVICQTDDPRLFIHRYILKKRFITLTFQAAAQKLFHDLILAVQNLQARFCQDQVSVLMPYFYISFIRVYGQCHV